MQDHLAPALSLFCICALPIAVTALVATLVLMPSGANAGAGTVYGKALTGKTITKISALLETPEKYVGKVVRVDGLATDVCTKRGCWVSIGSDKEFQTLRFKVTDGVIVFPVGIKGKRITAEGVFTRIDLTQEQAVARAKHFAEEKGQPFDPKSVEKARVIYQIRGAGAVVR